MTEVYAVNIDNLLTEPESLLKDLVSAAKWKRIQRLRNPRDRLRTALGEIMVRAVIAHKTGIKYLQLDILTDKLGKPYVENNALYFNISHSGRWAVAAISPHSVGVDIQEHRSVDIPALCKYLAPPEKEYILNQQKDTGSRFYRIWVLKESYLKYRGKGFYQSLKSFCLDFDKKNQPLLVDTVQSVFFKEYSLAPGYSLAVCSANPHFHNHVGVFIPASLLHFLKDQSV